MSDYHTLLQGVFLCGIKQVKEITENHHIQWIVDLRGEIEVPLENSKTNWVHFPLIDGKPNQTEQLKKAIDFVATKVRENEPFVLH
ncbi:hypothetical protein [Alkalihalobacillus sp. LMS39]|uniref:hypothetical protein n=1 Tax=Alkalihalobacillus sp. LMS39 TaxID=2924032 RepID=UPI001FB4C6FE|nr:hypothetical protein [Alkalihalobacillus sp. LMS39]UOE96278.1 hypothetical protein MM271_12025 [Alkalihalobacillus sp. LMS39]